MLGRTRIALLVRGTGSVPTQARGGSCRTDILRVETSYVPLSYLARRILHTAGSLRGTPPAISAGSLLEEGALVVLPPPKKRNGFGENHT